MRTHRMIGIGLLACTAMSGFAKDNEIVTSTKYLHFDNYLNGKTIKIEKVFDKSTGKYEMRSNDASISSVQDLEKIRKNEEAAQKAKYGAIKGDLRKKFDLMDDKSEKLVVIVPKMPSINHPDKTKNDEAFMKQHSAKVAKLQPFVAPAEISSKYNLHIKKKDNNYVVASIKKEDLKKIRFDQNIASIEEYVVGEPCTDYNFNVLASSAYNPGPVPSNAASGINVATFETGIWQSLFYCWGLPVGQIDIDNNTISHSQETFLCLKNAASGANLYHRNSLSFDGTADQDYIVNNGIRTVSRSYTNSTDPNTNEFRVMDDFAYRWPYPVFCNPTANSGYDQEVNWQCYNAISVGNVRHTDLTTYEMNYCTQARNPEPVYGSPIDGDAGDREMPYVVAPGWHPNSGSFFDYCLGTWGACGTSYSAPTASGMAACVRAANGLFNSWPEIVRVALMLTAQNVHGGYWDRFVDGLDGAGVVSGSSAVNWAQNAVQVYPEMTSGVEKGFAVGSWYTTDSTVKRFKVLVPSVKPAGKHLRVVLTWDSRPDLTNATNELSDLDLTGFTTQNGTYYYSSSWDSNVEMFDVPNNELVAGQTYDFQVNAYALRLPVNTNYFYWALGWEWVVD